MQMDQIGQGISNRRKQLGLSQEELAKQIGVTRQAVSRWESGSALPSVDNMIELSRALEISVDELLQLAPQERASSLTPQSLGLLLDEQTARQEKRIKRLTIALIAAALVLAVGIGISTAVSVVRSSRMEDQLNEQISGVNRTVSANLSSINSRISQTVQQALNEGNSRLTDSSYRESYVHEHRAFALDLIAQVKELGEYANAEFYFLSSSGNRVSVPAEWKDGGFTGRILIPDEGQDFISGRLYLSWQEGGETITEKIPFYNLTTCYLRMRIDGLHLNTATRQGYDLRVNPYTLISFSYEFADTYPTCIRYDIFHDGELIKTLTEPIVIRYNEIDKNSFPTGLTHTLPNFVPLDGITTTEGLMLRVNVTDALGREFTKEVIPE